MARGDEAGDARGVSLADPMDNLETAYRTEAAMLLRRVRSNLGSAEDANDLVQDAFVHLVGAQRTVRFNNLPAYLNRIVRNLLVDRSRRLSVRPEFLPLEAGLDVAQPPDQGEAIELEEMRQKYREIVASLPPRMREVFILNRVKGLSYREIALRLDISIRTVEGHIAEAIVRIGRGLDL